MCFRPSTNASGGLGESEPDVSGSVALISMHHARLHAELLASPNFNCVGRARELAMDMAGLDMGDRQGPHRTQT